MTVKKLPYFANGEFKPSQTTQWMDCYDPSTGEVIAQAPQCTVAEVEEAVAAAAAAFPAWADTPASKRVQVLFRMKALLDQHLDELTYLVAQEHGKVWDEAMGDVLKVTEVVEFACGIPQLMKGPALMNCTTGYDTTQYMEPVGVFAGIAPWNFPAMIPMGWMAPLCIATGNTMVLKAASFTPQSSLRIAELWAQAGLPKGVINVVTCSRHEAEILLKHPDIKGVSFVGSTAVGLHIYATAAAAGKRVQALTEAKNHALVLRDAALERSARGIINSACGCAGERCMALPVVVAEEAIADELVATLVRLMGELKIGPAYDKTSQLGPLVNAEHRQSVIKWIEKGVEEGATLVLDGRGIPSVPGYENGFYLGPTLFDHVTAGHEHRRPRDLRAGAVHQAGQGLRGRVGRHERQRVRQRLGDLHAERLLRPRVRPADARRHGGHQRGHPGAAGRLRLHRPQELVLRRSARHGHRRRALLHRAEERHQPLVLRGRGA